MVESRNNRQGNGAEDDLVREYAHITLKITRYVDQTDIDDISNEEEQTMKL